MGTFLRLATMIASIVSAVFAAGGASAADYQLYRSGVCATNSPCFVFFDTVPAAKRLTINNFSCYTRFHNGDKIYLIDLRVLSSAGKYQLSITPAMSYQSTVNDRGVWEVVYTSNDMIKAVAVPGQRFRVDATILNQVDFQVSTVYQLSCHISGTMN